MCTEMSTAINRDFKLRRIPIALLSASGRWLAEVRSRLFFSSFSAAGVPRTLKALLRLFQGLLVQSTMDTYDHSPTKLLKS